MKRRKAAVLFCLLAMTMLVAWSGCGSLPDGWEGLPQPRVLVSFPPIYSFTKSVAGDQAGIICLCTTLGPHDYVFNINDSIKLKRANLFFANGQTLDDHFTDKMAANSGNTKLRYRKLADDLPAALLKEGKAHAHEHGPDHDHDHEHGRFDPHVWLGIPQAIGMVEQIRDDLKQVDGAHTDLYQKNAAAYIERLEKLHQDGKEQLKGLKEVPVITFHESMGYFADSFGLNVLGAIEPQAGHPPTDAALLRLTKKCDQLPERQKRRVLIAIEPQYPEGHAKILADQLDKAGIKQVALVTVDPLETCSTRDDLDAEWYVKMMEKNINTLAKYAK
jgi:zinc transport system substrate-binding protein